MTSYTPTRDDSGRIVGMERAPSSRFAETLHATMAAVGAEEPRAEAKEAPHSRYRPGMLELAAIGGGLLIAAVAIALLNTFWPAAAPRPRATATVAPPTAAPTLAPTAAPPTTQLAYASPGGALMGTIPFSVTLSYQHSAWPGWAGVAWQGSIVWVAAEQGRLAGLPDLAPPPTAAPRPPAASAPAVEAAPDRGCDPTVNPIYVVEQDVSGPNGEPWGHARGVSCVSQEEAQRNMEQQAEAVRANVATADAVEQPAPTVSAR